jgi:transcriptional regulator with XRE-family HTH domain
MNVIRELRHAANMSQGDVAKKMGYSSPQFVSNWERGLSMPPPGSVRKLAKVLGSEDFEDKYIEHAATLHIEDLKTKIRGK